MRTPKRILCRLFDAYNSGYDYRPSSICRENVWEFIVTFRDGNLPTVWEEVNALNKLEKENVRYDTVKVKGKDICRNYKWINSIDYKGFELNWFECVEQIED
ncbi:hypothetical protein MCHI_000469, partial [Candidatus Magnetoovum chiemensis]